MQMHHHASLPEAIQPALFQHSNQSGTAHSPLCTTAAHGSHRNVAVNQILNQNMVTITLPTRVCCSVVDAKLALHHFYLVKRKMSQNRGVCLLSLFSVNQYWHPKNITTLWNTALDNVFLTSISFIIHCSILQEQPNLSFLLRKSQILLSTNLLWHTVLYIIVLV